MYQGYEEKVVDIHTEPTPSGCPAIDASSLFLSSEAKILDSQCEISLNKFNKTEEQLNFWSPRSIIVTEFCLKVTAR